MTPTERLQRAAWLWEMRYLDQRSVTMMLSDRQARRLAQLYRLLAKKGAKR